MRDTIDFKITVPHDVDCYRIGWFFPNGWRGIGPTERRDRGARRVGKRSGHFPEWFILACNSPNCDGRAVVPVSLLLDHADGRDPDVRR